ncbi:MAG: prepilin-type N-terminal cleavage/methylation domain-containing protein, partial [Epsilonproteobacteria bacterium]|nr:prepilin-type N-terminal cleavage/methylation domain-containing protein [Campylobacterota bacterium]
MRRGFTLIEILISTALLGLVLLALYGALESQRRSTININHYLKRTLSQDRALMVIYYDLIRSDGNITLKKGEMDTLCINSTANSLYGLDRAKVCYLVLKDGNYLLRVEGNNYSLPLGLEDKVAIDKIFKGIKLFDVYRNKDKILLILQEANKKPYSFLVEGIVPPPKKIKRDIQKRVKRRDNNISNEKNQTSPIKIQ